MAKEKRKDKSRVVLRVEELQRNDGTYQHSWMDANHKRRYVYARSLDDLRAKEAQIEKDKSDGIKTEARYTTVNELYEPWKVLKRGLKAIPLKTINICMIPLFVPKSGSIAFPPDMKNALTYFLLLLFLPPSSFGLLDTLSRACLKH